MGTEEHRPAPEFGQQLALNPDVLDVLGVGWRLDGRNDLVELDSDDRIAARREVDLSRCAVEIPRSAAPLLTLAAVHR